MLVCFFFVFRGIKLMKKDVSTLDSNNTQSSAEETKLKRKCPEKIYDIQNYSINLMWINRTLDPSMHYITPHQSEEELVRELVEKAKKWKASNPEAAVTIWYDSLFVTQEALKNTKTVIVKKARDDINYDIQLKDIREIPLVSSNSDSFSDQIPIYTRVDLMKLILCLHNLEANGNDAVIFADLIVGDLRRQQDRMNKQELFNEQIMERLRKIGMQQIADSDTNENQFFQFIYKPETILALKIYINACLERISFALNIKWDNKKHLEERTLTDLCTMVYNQQEQLHALVEAFNFNKPITVKAKFLKLEAKDEWVEYNQQFGNLSLGNFYLRDYNSSYVTPGFDMAVNQAKTKPLSEYVTLPERTYYEFSRKDLDSRPGGNHSELIGNLTRRSPADGSKIYKYEPLLIKTTCGPDGGSELLSESTPAVEINQDALEHTKKCKSPLYWNASQKGGRSYRFF